ncbi:MAG: hypothetical protein MUO21_03820, partial [Nitrososphaeraceae archaeon]|nr:hypothetical protein [Nitrososphaeraceae archaeon]
MPKLNIKPNIKSKQKLKSNNNSEITDTHDTYDNFDNYSNVSINNKFDVMDDNICPAFFTAQGDYSTQGPYKGPANIQSNIPNKDSLKGKTVGQLREETRIIDSDSFSLLDSDFSNDSLFDPSIL